MRSRRGPKCKLNQGMITYALLFPGSAPVGSYPPDSFINLGSHRATPAAERQSNFMLGRQRGSTRHSFMTSPSTTNIICPRFQTNVFPQFSKLVGLPVSKRLVHHNGPTTGCFTVK